MPGRKAPIDATDRSASAERERGREEGDEDGVNAAYAEDDAGFEGDEGGHGKEEEEEEEGEEGVVNHNRTCNGCHKVTSPRPPLPLFQNFIADRNQAIYGLRHKCRNCRHFNYCTDCMKKASKTHHPRHRFETLYKADSREAHGNVGGEGRRMGGGTGHHHHRPERYGSGGHDDRKNDKPSRTVYTANGAVRVPKRQEGARHGDQRGSGGRDQGGGPGQHHSFRSGQNGPEPQTTAD